MATNRMPSRRALALLASITTLGALMLGPASADVTFAFTRISGSTGFEQGVNITPGGTIYVDEPSGLGAHSKLFRSVDGGASFQRLTFPSPVGRFPGGGDSDVVLGDDGRVYFLDLWGGSNSITVSEDGGNTWSYGTPITTIPTSDRQWIALGERDPGTGKDTVYVIYSRLFVTPDWTWLARSTDGGQTFTHHRPIPALTGGTDGPTGNLVADGRFLAFVSEDGGQLKVLTSNDAGDTWTSTKVSLGNEVDNNIPSIALDGNDLHVAYVNRIDHSIMVATSHDRGATWALPERIAEGGVSVFTWIAARDGKVGVAWYNSAADVSTPDDVPASGVWDVRYTESTDAGATFAPSIALAAEVKEGPICTRGLDCDGGREVGDFIALEIGYDGMSSVAYYDGGPGYLARQLAPL